MVAPGGHIASLQLNIHNLKTINDTKKNKNWLLEESKESFCMDQTALISNKNLIKKKIYISFFVFVYHKIMKIKHRAFVLHREQCVKG